MYDHDDQLYHPLIGSRLKLKRAKTHINTLNRSIKKFFDLNPPEVSLIKDESLEAHGIHEILRLNPALHPPIEWGLTIGDIVTNLRASLDYIAWELACIKNPKPNRRTQFPIFNTREEFNDPKRRGQMIVDIPLAAVNIIEKLQPYNDIGTDYHPLLILNKLVNSDKHRTITPVFTKIGFSLTPDALPHYMTLNKTADFVVTTKVAAHMNGQLKPTLSSDIAFNIETLENTPIEGLSVQHLTLIHDFIRDEVIPSFTSFFEES